MTQTGARLVVFYVPTREQVDPSSLDTFLRRYGRSEGDLNLRAVDDRLSAICQRRSLECVIPTERFQQAQGPLYLRRDSRWNVAGHRLVGQMIAELCCQSVAGQK